MNTIRWTINEKDVEKRRREIELRKLYKHAYLAWDKFYGQDVKEFPPGYDFMGYQRFGSAPVRDTYWDICPKLLSHPIPEKIRDLFGKAPDKKKGEGSTMVFRRFPALSLPDGVGFPSDILTKSLLGLLDEVAYKFSQGNAILNDAWVINLRETKKENLMLDMFLRGFDGKAEELKKAWEKQMGQNFESELTDLLKVYKDAAEHLCTQERYKMSHLVAAMKDFIKVHEDRQQMEKKLAALVQKLEPMKPCEGCSEDEENEDEE